MTINVIDKPQIAGILLAAGHSSRMGQPKALLDYNGSSFIDTILNHLYRAGCDPVMSILGESGDLICQCTTVNNYECHYNPVPEEGMLSSLKIAIKKLPASCAGFILALVDHPVVNQDTYQNIVVAARRNPKRIIIPRFYGKKGHPVFFGRSYFKQLLDTPDGSGARIVVRDNQQDIHFLDLEDEGILYDIDTPEELRKWAN